MKQRKKTETIKTPEFLYHLCSEKNWQNASKTALYSGSETDLRDGFIHLSTAEQIARTAELHFKGVKKLLLLTIASIEIYDHLKWEISREGQLFPHLHGKLNLSSVKEVKRLKTDSSGNHVIPKLQ